MYIDSLALYLSLSLFAMFVLPAPFAEARSLRRSKGSSRRRDNSLARLQSARIDAIQQDLLKRMDLHRPPHRTLDQRTNTSKVAEERKMLQLYRRSLHQLRDHQHDMFDEKEYRAKEFNTFTQKESHPDGVKPQNWYSSDNPSTLRLHFEVSIPQPRHPNREKLVHSASLQLFKAAVRPENLPLSSTIDLAYRINIYQLLEPVQHRHHKPLRRLLDSKLVSLEDTKWEEFDIRSAVQSWSDDPTTNFGMELEGEDENMGAVLDLITAQPGSSEVFPDELFPQLNVFTQTRTILSSRQKRSDTKMDCVQGDGETQCCRYPLWISFKDIGWDDWIVEPSGFQAYFCDGSCPYNYKSAHMFSQIKSFINMYNPKAAPAPCCTATNMSPLTLVHYNEDGNVVVGDFEDMIVQECMCA